ncbi:MAG: MBL fold metallo-hydrolase [Promethearchaeota archaeon]
MTEVNQLFDYVDITNNVVAMVPSKPIREMYEAAESVTTTCIALPNELIFVDCGCYPELIRKFREDMEAKFERKTSHLFFTHTHWDHIIAMEVFKDVNIVAFEMGIQGVEIVVKLKNNKSIEEVEKSFVVKRELAEIITEVDIFMPNIIVKKKEFRIDSDGKEVIFRRIGGHSPDSAYVYIPSEKVLCTGDNLLECFAQIPGNPDETLEIFDHWESLDIDKIIPGHGKILDREYISKTAKYFRDLNSTLENLCAQGITVKHIISHSSIPEYFAKSQPNWLEFLPGRGNLIKNYTRSWCRFIKKKLRSSK